MIHNGETSREGPRYTQTAGANHNGEMKQDNQQWCQDGRLERLPDSIAIYTWGRGEDGQLGLGDTNDQPEPVLVDLPGTVKQISCGSGHTVILDRKGQVFTWGRGDDGRLGHGDNGWKYVPRLVEALAGKQIHQVTCGSYHTAAVSLTGELFTWGGGMYGKLGHGDENGHAVPVQVAALSNVIVVQVACGSRHTVVLTQSLKVYSWGDKENGVSGHSTIETDGHQYAPRVVSGLLELNCTQVAACGFHTAALTETGEIFTWGEGKFGRLGHGCERNQPIPKMIQGPLSGKHVAQVVCGGFHTAAITNDGELYTWGGGEHGQLGHGDKVNKTVPWLVSSLSKLNLVQITCGWSHTVALTDNGEVFTWGNGDHGKLGHGSSTKVTTPKQVESLRGVHVCRIASYNEHTAALTSMESLSPRSHLDSTLLQDYGQVVNTPEFSDVKFVVEGRIIHAHKVILASRCQHFNAMFTSGMREAFADEIKIPNVKYATFLALMNYLYSDIVTNDPTIAIELYAAADMFVIDRLKSKCAEMVQQQLDMENSCTLLCIADAIHAHHPREVIMKFIVNNFDGVSKLDSFQALSKNLIIEILTVR
jgi:RCC1 and BTB domain-containing protein